MDDPTIGCGSEVDGWMHYDKQTVKALKAAAAEASAEMDVIKANHPETLIDNLVEALNDFFPSDPLDDRTYCPHCKGSDPSLPVVYSHAEDCRWNQVDDLLDKMRVRGSKSPF